MKNKYLFILLTFCLYQAKAERPFISTWTTTFAGSTGTNQMRFYATGNNFQIAWANVQNKSDSGHAVGVNGANTITFPSPGNYRVEISAGAGSFSAIQVYNVSGYSTGDCLKLVSIDQWGDILWSSFNNAFRSCSNMIMNATDTPNLISVTDMSFAFAGSTSLISNTAMNDWNVGHVTNMSDMFTQSHFNQNINNWDVGQVILMSDMFSHDSLYNQPLNNWQTNNVAEMGSMFFDAVSFNQPLDKWDVGSVTYMQNMFGYAVSFNQPIGNWNVSNVNDVSGMFWGASAFNQPLNNWNVGNVTDMEIMFQSASTFNQPLDKWDVGNVTDMHGMFLQDSAFNQPIANWNVGSVRDMRGLFGSATSFNQNIENWKITNVVSMDGMFSGAISFNQPLNSWDISQVTSMNGLFSNASLFNQPLTNWNTGKVTSMVNMFKNAQSFNQDIGSWNLQAVLAMNSMLDSCGLDCINYGNILKSWAVNPATPDKLFLGAATLTYDSSIAKQAHDILTFNKHWTITGDKISQCSILPVAFVTFRLQPLNNSIRLDWSVGEQTNVQGYEVEQSSDGHAFHSIGYVGENAFRQNYSFIQNDLPTQITYYRIKEIDNDGKVTYSSVCQYDLEDFHWTVIGNPIQHSAISLTLNNPSKVLIQIVSLSGTISQTIQKGTLESGDYSIPLTLDELSAGIYIVRLTVNNKVYWKRVMK